MPAKGYKTDVYERLMEKTIKQGDCLIWTGYKVRSGHGYIWYHGKMIRINRLIAHLHHGMDLNDPNVQANHTRDCTSSSCWYHGHIYVGTQYDNVRDQIANGKFHYGTKNLNGSPDYVHWRDKEK